MVLEFRNVWDQSRREEGLIRMVIGSSLLLRFRLLSRKAPSPD